jgi:hypothetical protein
MNENHEHFRDRLIGSERITPSLKERYEREMRGLLETKLNRTSKAVNIFALVLSLASVGIFLYVLIATDMPAFAKFGIGIGILFSAGWIALLVRILRRGSMDIKNDANAMAGMNWVFVVILIVMFMLVGGNQLRGIMMVLNGMVFLVGGMVFLLGNSINQEDLQTREALLKIKYRLVDLNEHFGAHTTSSGAPDEVTSPNRGKTEREERNMYDKKLSTPRKWGIIAFIPIMLAQTVAFTCALFIAPELPVLAKAGFGLGIVFSLTFAVFLARIVRKGSFNIKKDPNILTGLTWVFLVFFMTIVMMLADEMSDTVKGISMVLNTLVFLMFGVVFLLQNTIHQANLRTREKLQEIESQLADLSKRVAG